MKGKFERETEKKNSLKVEFLNKICRSGFKNSRVLAIIDQFIAPKNIEKLNGVVNLINHQSKSTSHAVSPNSVLDLMVLALVVKI